MCSNVFSTSPFGCLIDTPGFTCPSKWNFGPFLLSLRLALPPVFIVLVNGTTIHPAGLATLCCFLLSTSASSKSCWLLSKKNVQNMTTFAISSVAVLPTIILPLGNCNSVLTSYLAFQTVPHSPFSREQPMFFLKCESGQIPRLPPHITNIFPSQLQQNLGDRIEEAEKKGSSPPL